jgi:amidase
MMPGYSTYGGQTQSPYVMGGLVEGELMLGHSVSKPSVFQRKEH